MHFLVGILARAEKRRHRIVATALVGSVLRRKDIIDKIRGRVRAETDSDLVHLAVLPLDQGIEDGLVIGL